MNLCQNTDQLVLFRIQQEPGDNQYQSYSSYTTQQYRYGRVVIKSNSKILSG